MSIEQEDLVMSANASTTVITVRTVAGVRPWAMMKADEEGKNISQFFSLAMVYMMNHDISPRDINAAIKSLKRLEEVEAELLKEREGHQNALNGLKEAIKGISEMSQKIEQLEDELEAARASKSSVEAHMTEKQRKSAQEARNSAIEANNRIAEAEKKAKEFKARLDKANARLKEEGITEGPIFGKQTVVQF